MKNFYRALLLLVLSGIGLLSCKKNNDNAIIGTKLPPGKLNPPVGPPGPVTNAPGIYAAGTIATDLYGSDTRANYWKDGVATKLSNKLSDARAIGVLGTDVYVAGYEDDGNAEMAGYWKNGTFVKLRDGSDVQSFATGLCISGNDVYISGWYTKTTWDEPTPIYWKNGVAVALPAKGATGDGYANAYGITVSGSDVYVCGAYRISKGRYLACYWKNGILNTFNANVYESSAYAIVVAGGLVHLAGTATASLTPFPVKKPAAWNDGILNMLDISTYPSGIAYDIAASGNDIHIAGMATGTTGLALYWKNGTLTPIANSEEGRAVALDGADVFIGGALRTNLGVGESFATYWKNTQQVFSHNSGADRSRIFDMLVIR